MAEFYIDNFRCEQCGFDHDTREEAVNCHNAVVTPNFECEVCHKKHERSSRDAAICCSVKETPVKKELNGAKAEVTKNQAVVPEVVSPTKRKVKIGVSDLREHLFATIEALQDPESGMDIERAKTIGSMAQVVINLQKVELDYLREMGAIMGSGFVPLSPEEYDAIKRRNLDD